MYSCFLQYLRICFVLIVVPLSTCRFAFGSETRPEERIDFPYYFADVSAGSSAPAFHLRFPYGSVLFDSKELTFNVVRKKSEAADPYAIRRFLQSDAFDYETIKLNFTGSQKSHKLLGSKPMNSKTNFLLGDKMNWKTDRDNYYEILYDELYQGIDLRYYVFNNELKYDYILEPHADISQIKMHYSGIQSLTVNNEGELIIQSRLTSIKDYLPESYQWIDGKKHYVNVRFQKLDDQTVGFVADYDKHYALIIDPALIYSTFVGGSGDDYEYVGGIDRDASGNIYLTGWTFSNNFPTTTGALQTGFGGYYDCFIIKLDPTGSNLVYSTYIGGSGNDGGYSLKVEQSTGNLWVVGSSDFTSFPTTPGAFQPANGGTGLTDAFVIKLNATGSNVIYGTFYGYGYSDYGHGIDIDPNGQVLITGESNGNSYTTPGAFQPGYGGGPWDGWVVKFDSTLSTVIYATMFGGGAEDVPLTIKSAPNDEAIIAGWIVGGGMPVVAGSYDVTYNGGLRDAFVARVSSDGSSFIYATYLGGPGNEMIWNALSVDNAGNPTVAGFCGNGYPVTAGAFQTTYGGGVQDVFVTTLNASGTALIYSTYLGGPGDDRAYGLFTSSSGIHYITGHCEDNYPITPCTLDSTYNGAIDAFISVLNSSLDQLLFSTYLGGSNSDKGYNITAWGNSIYVAGETRSGDFPTIPGSYDNSYNGTIDLFLCRVDLDVNNITALFNVVSGNCSNGPVQITNNSAGANWYSWDFGDGSTDTAQVPSHTYSQPGTYTISLTAINSCGGVDTASHQVTIGSLVTADFNYNYDCDTGLTLINLSNGATSYSWDFGDGNSASGFSPYHSYSPGTYQVTLISSDGGSCADTITQQVDIPTPALASFLDSVAGCQSSVQFLSQSQNAVQHLWYFGDGSSDTTAAPWHSYQNPGTYTVTLVVNPLTCPDTVSRSITIDAPPVSDFSFIDLCNNQIQFINNSSAGTTYAWSFGDGNSSSSTSPIHQYSFSGTYDVELITSTGVPGCSDTASISITPISSPSATFTAPANNCPGLVSFINNSLNASNYLWNFGDGTVDITTNPQHLYSTPGNYLVQLIANPGTCPDTFDVTISIEPLPVAVFSFTANCDLSVDFTSSSTGIASYSWSLGDGNTSGSQMLNHQYASAGTYNVSLEVQNSFGCSQTTQQQVTANSGSVSSFSVQVLPCDTVAEFINTGTYASAIWDLGDGNTSSLPQLNHDYAPGSYQVRLITDPTGCPDTSTQTVIINPRPVAKFAASQDCSLGINIYSSSNPALAYQWDMGDGTVTSGTVGYYRYQDPGQYRVTLQVADALGCDDVYSDVVNVLYRIQAQFLTSYDSCLNEVAFTPINGAQSYSWQYGDNSVSSDDMTHVYSQGGTYPVMMVTNPGTGCEDTLIQQVVVPETQEDFVYIPNCFTPNNDGLNDFFEYTGSDYCHQFELYIFNRWGELIFKSENVNDNWDGRYKGELVPSDVYVYLLKRGDTNYNGTVTVLY